MNNYLIKALKNVPLNIQENDLKRNEPKNNTGNAA